MRKTFLLSILSLFLHMPVQAQEGWHVQNPFPTAADIYDAHFISVDEGWVVGANGLILYTTDKGDNWTQQQSKTPRSLQAIYFVNATTGWAVGNEVTIRKTIDGGSTWTVQHGGRSENITLFDVHFVHPDTGWAVGEQGTVLYTDDGGSRWVERNSDINPAPIFSSVYFVSNKEGWAVGTSGLIVHTTNGGESWETQSTPVRDNIEDITFVNKRTGWAVGGTSGSNFILHTTDGGMNWSSQRADIGEPATRLHHVSFADEMNGWAVGASGLIAYTANGGQDWEAQTSPANKLLRSVFAVDAQAVWAVGAAGYLLLSENAGTLWEEKSRGTASQEPSSGLNDVFFVDANTGWAVGYSGIILHTRDAGSTWTRQEISPPRSNFQMNFFQFHAVHFMEDGLRGWAVGEGPDRGNVRNFNIDDGTIFRTTDGGATWEEQQITPTVLNDIYFVDEMNGWAIGDDVLGDDLTLVATVWSTTDGGLTWADDHTIPYRNADREFTTLERPQTIHFVNADTGWVGGGRATYLVHTEDGGDHWSPQALGDGLTHVNLKDIFFVNADTGWAVGDKGFDEGLIYHTENGGDTWALQRSGPGGYLFGVHFVNPDTGWAVGNGGILYTENGGRSWERQIPSTSLLALRQVFFADKDHGWAVGFGRIIVHTANGGRSRRALPAPELSITHSALEGERDAGHLFAFTVSANVRWTVADDVDWLTYRPDNSRSLGGLDRYNHEVIRLSYVRNPTIIPREAMITFTATGHDALTQTFTFRQAEGLPTNLTIDAQTGVDVDGLPHGRGQFTIDVDSDTDWTVGDGNTDWITFTDLGNTGRDDGFSANGSGTMGLVYSANNRVATRSATVIFTTDDGMHTRMLPLTQNAAPATISILPNVESVSAQRLPNTAGDKDISINSNTTWIVETDPGTDGSWITSFANEDGSSFSGGNMEGVLRIHHAINEDVRRREVTMVFTTSNTEGAPAEARVTLTQEGATPVLTIMPASRQDVGLAVGRFEVMVTSNLPWTVGLVSGSDAAVVTRLFDGANAHASTLNSMEDQTLMVEYAENPRASERTAILSFTPRPVTGVDLSSVTEQRISVVQAAAAPRLSIMAEGGLTVEDRAGEDVIVLPNTAGSFRVTARANTTWMLSESALWFSTADTDGVPLTRGTGDGEVVVRYVENRPGAAERSVALITFGAEGVEPSGLLELRVTQVAGPPALNFQAAVESGVDEDMLPPQAGRFDILVVSNREWAVDDEDENWVTELSDGTRMDAGLLFSNMNQTLTVSYAANTTGSERATNLRFSDAVGRVRGTEALQALRMVQAPFQLAITPPAQTRLGAGGGSLSIRVASNTNWSVQTGGRDAATLITELSDGSTMHATSLTSSGDKTVTLRYSANTTSSQRQARLVFSSADVPLDPLHTIMLTQGLPAPFLTITAPITPDLSSLGTAAGSFTIVVASNREWTVQTGGEDAAALLIELSDGTTMHASSLTSSRTALTVRYSENTTPDLRTRTATLTFTAPGVSPHASHRVDISQAAENPILRIEPSTDLELFAVRGEFMIEVTSNTIWQVDDGDDGDDEGVNWIDNLSDGTNMELNVLESSGSQRVSVRYNSNTTTAQRETTLRFTAAGAMPKELRVRQRAGVETPSLRAISAVDTRRLPSEAGSFNISVSSNTDWRVDLAQTRGRTRFILELSDGSTTHPSALVSTANRTLTVRYSANTGGSNRSIALLFQHSGPVTSGVAAVIDVTQLSGTAPPIILDPSLPDGTDANRLAYQGGRLNIQVSANTAWTVNDGSSAWITELSDGASTDASMLSSQGNKTLTLRYAANPTNRTRAARLTFAATGITPSPSISLRQLANPVPVVSMLSISPFQLREVGHQMGSFVLSIGSNTDWEVSDGAAAWITELSDGENTHAERLMSSGNRSLTIRYAANPRNQTRTARLTFEAGDLMPQVLNIRQGEGIVTQTRTEGHFAGLRLYPVPAEHYLQVESAEDAEASLYDAQGALLETYALEAGKRHTLSLVRYAAGVYLLELRTKTGRTLRRFLRR